MLATNAGNKAFSLTSVSVIIPVYKVYPTYFADCLESVAAQAEDDIAIEIVTIFDGVPDDLLLSVLDRYSNKVKLVVRVIEHRGVSAARNLGMTLAKGSWLTFLDADDKLPRHALALLTSFVSNDKFCDIVLGDFVAEFSSGVIERRSYSDSSIPASRDLAIRLRQDVLKQGKYAGSVWAKLYRSSFLADNRIKFDEALQVGEDTEFVFKAACKAKSAAYCHELAYCYERRQGSATLGWREDYVQRVLTSMEAIGHSVSESGMEMGNQLLCSYVAFHILLITVHYLFNPAAPWSMSDRRAEYNRVLDNPMLTKGLNGYRPSDFSAARRVALAALKHRLFWMSWLISWVRQKQLSK